VPAYNAARYIEGTLLSVCRQSVPAWELFVVDDGSTDDTLRRAQYVVDSRIRFVSQINQGPSAARNHGLRLATAPVVLFLDSDDLLAPNALERLLQPLEDEEGCVAAYGEVTTIDEAGMPIGTGARPVFSARPSGDVLEALIQRNFIVSGGALCIRRASAIAAGAFREDLAVAEDLEFWCRLALVGPIRYIGGSPVLAYRIRQGSVVRSRGADPGDALRCIEAIFENPAIQARLGGRRSALSRKAQASVYSFTANEHLRAARWSTARRLLCRSLLRNPFQRREWLLFPFACVGWLPRVVRKHLK
jgi:glycosyltransferase involved in cell wall biosynthesis